MTQIIAIANEKGGVAKTTTAVSLAGALIEMGREVLLVDLDPQANLSLALGIPPHTVRRSIADVFLNSAAPLSVSRATEIPGLDLIPSSPEMGMAERFLPIRQQYKLILRQALSSIQYFDTVILDCPPSMGVITQNAMVAADLLIIPTQAEYFSAYALKNMMSAIRQVRGQNNPGMIYRILITMYDMRNRAHRTLKDQLITTFGHDGLLDTIVEIDTKLRESPIIGIPIMHYISNTRSAMQYRALAEELIENVGELERKAFAQSA